MSTARLDLLKDLEGKAQAKWEAGKTFEACAPTDGSKPPKFLVTFPFPYMNGKLHLGHGFSLTKAEFAARFWRMQGRKVLWPFGLHVTGTPIAACAQKIGNEMAKYGNPPVFPEEDLIAKAAAAEEAKVLAPGQHKSKRGKTGPAKPQWQIMQSMGIPDSEIPKFADPLHWLQYFPNLAVEDLKLFGAHVDWRRSFITTDVNPFFDAFVQWQFRKLREGGYLGFGKRYCVYSPLDGQPCADHDRASGEGVLPQEYTLVKLTVQGAKDLPAFSEFAHIIGDKKVVLPGATLRAETVVGQTNCWLSPEFSYKAYEVTSIDGSKEIFMMTARAARNMTYQGVVVNGTTNTDVQPLFEVDGAKMIGLPLSAPHAPFATIYSLPMTSISETKGTGVVMSVPSDSPDDYINFIQLFNKPEYRAKLGIKDEWVTPFEIVPIINIPDSEMGQDVAKYAVTKLGINGPKDTAKLEEAKQIAYQAGFYNGVMIAGPFAGLKVSEAKVKMAKDLIDSGNGLRYYEPTKEVMSRSGDECVVALCDQWFIEYGKEEWKSVVVDHLASMEMYFPGIRHGFEETLNWLADWPCSRTFGLGTKLPCDASNSMIIDSLSDSTIYMAYYTVAHYFHSAADGSLSLDATAPNAYGITPAMVTDAFWDFVLYGNGSAEELHAASGIPIDTAQKMRNEFAYWYPVDLRVSAKDLIQNHLTMFLYNHAAIWPKDKDLWPKSIYCNGHIMVDNQKMSKSLGNFIMLGEAINAYGADCTRLACADAGDSMDDANFVRETATGFIMRLTTLIEQIKDLHSKEASFRTGEQSIYDRIMGDFINGAIETTTNYFVKMSFRMALQTAYFELTAEFNQYKLNCGDNNMHVDIVKRYSETIVLLLQPFAPHAAEHMWSDILGHTTPAAVTPFPVAAPMDYGLRVSSRLISDVVKDLRNQIMKNAKKRGPIDEMFVYVAPAYLPWQASGLATLRSIFEANGNALPADTAKQVMARKESWMTKDIMQDVMAFIAFAKSNADKFGPIALSDTPAVDDLALLNSVADHIAKQIGISKVTILSRDDMSMDEHKVAKSKARPGEPTTAFPPLKK